MKLEDVRQKLAEIRGAEPAAERAHELEFALYKAVLRAIATGQSSPALLAHEALRAESIEFPRWCA